MRIAGDDEQDCQIALTLTQLAQRGGSVSSKSMA
jgi:hypothetical protein